MTTPHETESARLLLRRIARDDAEAMFEVYGDGPAMRWVGDGSALTLAQCENWVDVTQKNYAIRGYGMFAIVERASGRVIGFVGLVHPGGQELPELKYALRRDAWGQGFATEAASALLKHAAAAWQVEEVMATVAPDHHVSQRVLLKAGMQLGDLRRNEDGSFTQMFAWRAA
jgi:RimJ/RimL family protein N-acetyltransferase